MLQESHSVKSRRRPWSIRKEKESEATVFMFTAKQNCVKGRRESAAAVTAHPSWGLAASRAVAGASAQGQRAQGWDREKIPPPHHELPAGPSGWSASF